MPWNAIPFYAGNYRKIFQDRPPDMDNIEYLVPRATSVGQFINLLSGRLHLPPGKALFVLFKNTLPPTASLMDPVYESNKDDDGFLYMYYRTEKTFG